MHIKMCSDCESCGLLNHCKQKMIEEVTRKCVRIVRHTIKEKLPSVTHVYFCTNPVWRHVHNQVVGTSLSCLDTSHIQNRLRHSESAEVGVNCVSRDNNMQHPCVRGYGAH